jgi:hypothetical protein
MDRSGRFDFWRVLICSRAITPPRMVPRLGLQTTEWSRWTLLALACLSIGAVLHLSLGDSSSSRDIDNTPRPAAVQAASPKAPW